MIKKNRKILRSAILSFLFLLLVNGMSVNVLNAQNDQPFIDLGGSKIGEIRERLRLTGDEAEFGTQTDLSQIVGAIIQTFLGFLGVVALILIIYGGYMWMTAGGNEEKVKKAQTLLRNAVIGLIIISLAYAITAFVIQRIVGAAV
ncbi:MAG TPA: hypothetical protein VGA49_01065 [Patescibacteria group bacterium]